MSQQAGAIVVPTESMAHLHRSESLHRYIKADPKDGDGYKAVLQVHHMLHCLVSSRLLKETVRC